MDRALQSMYTHYAGALPSQARSALQPWHRDTYHLFDDDVHEVTNYGHWFFCAEGLSRADGVRGWPFRCSVFCQQMRRS
jgi:hypothetical protein